MSTPMSPRYWRGMLILGAVVAVGYGGYRLIASAWEVWGW